ncbi:hypothetical protein KOW79_021105 [Hemibagrus wyckioides]|uniref:Uncharacterized protein n=1 Tax=Hemibagrus wyckioides TaxID=337641 RepID=A0A9D3N5Z3_9TELE|nr:hypothetical protein KOW79_021105 [Hemibagrus wyckioides]
MLGNFLGSPWRVRFSIERESRSSRVNTDTRLCEKLNLLMIFCFSRSAAALVKQLEGLIKSQIRKKRKQDGGEIIKNEDEMAEAGETGIRAPRLAPGI